MGLFHIDLLLRRHMKHFMETKISPYRRTTRLIGHLNRWQEVQCILLIEDLEVSSIEDE